MSYPPAMQALLDQFGKQDAVAQKMVQVGSFQPFDLVRVHSNPSTSVLTNAHEGSVATSTVVLLTDGQARAGLKFKPDTTVIRNRHDQQLHLIIASSIDQTITVEFEDYPAKQVQVTANQPALFSIGMLFEIPVIASTASFFDLATGNNDGNGNDDASGFTLTNSTFEDNVLHYTSGTLSLGALASGDASAISRRVSDTQGVRLELPTISDVANCSFLAILSGKADVSQLKTSTDTLAVVSLNSWGIDHNKYQGQLNTYSGGGLADQQNVAEFDAASTVNVLRRGTQLDLHIGGLVISTAESSLSGPLYLHVIVSSWSGTLPVDLFIDFLNFEVEEES